MSTAHSDTDFDDELFETILRSVSDGDEIRTLSQGRPNRIVAISRDGIRVATRRSEERGSGPQFVPASMISTAWAALNRDGSLSQEGLKYVHGVHRSVFICALLATFDEVEVESRRPTKLRMKQGPHIGRNRS